MKLFNYVILAGILLATPLLHSKTQLQISKRVVQKQYGLIQMKEKFPLIKMKDLEAIDRSLKKYGKLGSQGDFSQGLEYFQADHIVKIVDMGQKLNLQIFPKKGNWGFSAEVDKVTEKLENSVIESIAPEPNDSH